MGGAAPGDLLRGVSTLGGSASGPGGCLPLVRGARGGVCIPACNGADNPPVDRQRPVKT